MEPSGSWASTLKSTRRAADRDPAWIHGVQDAHAGIVMRGRKLGKARLATPSCPAVDYSDRAQTYQMGLETCVPVNCYKDVLVIKEYALNEPNAFQYKYYAAGVGNIRVDWSGDDKSKEKLELVKIGPLSPDERATANAEALKLEKHAYEINQKVFGQTAPAESNMPAQGTPAGAATSAVSPAAPTKAATMVATVQGTQAAATGPKLGHWEKLAALIMIRSPLTCYPTMCSTTLTWQ